MPAAQKGVRIMGDAVELHTRQQSMSPSWQNYFRGVFHIMCSTAQSLYGIQHPFDATTRGFPYILVQYMNYEVICSLFARVQR